MLERKQSEGSQDDTGSDAGGSTGGGGGGGGGGGVSLPPPIYGPGGTEGHQAQRMYLQSPVPSSRGASGSAAMAALVKQWVSTPRTTSQQHRQVRVRGWAGGAAAAAAVAAGEEPPPQRHQYGIPNLGHLRRYLRRYGKVGLIIDSTIYQLVVIDFVGRGRGTLTRAILYL